MLLENFYKVQKIDNLESNKYNAFIHLNKDHDIFKGHFPDNPVTPGVCMVQIIKDLTSQAKGVNLSLVSSNNIKFMAVINPIKNPDLKLSLDLKDNEDGTISVKNVTYFNDTVALKMSALYKML